MRIVLRASEVARIAEDDLLLHGVRMVTRFQRGAAGAIIPEGIIIVATFPKILDGVGNIVAIAAYCRGAEAVGCHAEEGGAHDAVARLLERG